MEGTGMTSRRGGLRQINKYGRLYRLKGDREQVEVLDARNNVVVTVEDATHEQTTKNNTTIVFDVKDESRLWMLPTIQVGVEEDQNLTGWRIRQESGAVWEILSVTLASAGHTWNCVCKKMKAN
jgi:hypothetical protein